MRQGRFVRAVGMSVLLLASGLVAAGAAPRASSSGYGVSPERTEGACGGALVITEMGQTVACHKRFHEIYYARFAPCGHTRDGGGRQPMALASKEVTKLEEHVSKVHIHLLVACPPSLSPAKVMEYLKGRSSRLLQEEFPHSQRASK